MSDKYNFICWRQLCFQLSLFIYLIFNAFFCCMINRKVIWVVVDMNLSLWQGWLIDFVARVCGSKICKLIVFIFVVTNLTTSVDQSHSREADSHLGSQDFHTIYGIQMFIAAYQRACLASIRNQMNLLVPPPLRRRNSLRYVLILCPFQHLGLWSSLFPSGS